MNTSTLQFDSMRVPYSKFVGGVLYTGTYILLLPLDPDGNLTPHMEMFGGYRDQVGRAKHISRSKYTPHQGSKECARRMLQSAKVAYGAFEVQPVENES